MDAAQSNIEVMDKSLEAILEGDLDGALTRFEEDARYGVAQWLPNAGLHEGHAGIRAYLGSVRERFGGSYQMLHLNVYATSDHVFAEMTRSSSDDAYASGSEHVMLVAHVVMGKIREVRELAYAIRD